VFFSLGSESASGGELGSISLQSSSPKHKAPHFLRKELGLDRVAKMTPLKKKLYDRIRTSESALSKLSNMTKNVKEVCQLDSNPLMWSLASSLNPDSSRFLASVVSDTSHEPKGKKWHYEEKVLAVSILKHTLKCYAFLWSLFSLASR
jgi:hypothetical protein